MKMRQKKLCIFSEFQISNITINASPQKYWHFVSVVSHLGFHFNRGKHRDSPQCPPLHLSVPSPCFSLPFSEESNLFPITGFGFFPAPFQSSACCCHLILLRQQEALGILLLSSAQQDPLLTSSSNASFVSHPQCLP